ncbi:MAG: hypothetical protein K2Q33_05080 [Gammaproteobacteria bacterium]|nr:hypothetical protein [Gammaproteobacteria bacterium]
MSKLINAVSGCRPAEEIFSKLGENNFSGCVSIANQLRSHNRPIDAIIFYRKALELGPNSKHVALAILETELQSDIAASADVKEILETLDTDFVNYFETIKLAKYSNDPTRIIESMGNSFEAFDSGAEPDWLYMRAAKKIVAPRILEKTEISQKSNLFFYWDKSNPPSEVAENIRYHAKSKLFNISLFSRESAHRFIKDYYGLDAANLFSSLRHPSEESDFVRFHAVHAFGGYYLDVDEQIISDEAFQEHIGPLDRDTYILAGSGPVQSAFFGAKKGSPIIAEALRILIHNCYVQPNLSMWLKTGPGPITRAICRKYFLHLNKREAIPDFILHSEEVFASTFRSVDVSYRNDSRDWRVYEANRSI